MKQRILNEELMREFAKYYNENFHNILNYTTFPKIIVDLLNLIFGHGLSNLLVTINLLNNI